MDYNTFFWYALTATTMMSFGIYFAIKLALQDGVDRYIKKRDEKKN